MRGRGAVSKKIISNYSSYRNVITATTSGVLYRYEFPRLKVVYIGVEVYIDQGPRCCFSFNMVLNQTDWCDARPTGGITVALILFES